VVDGKGQGAKILRFGTPASSWGVVSYRPIYMGGWFIQKTYRGAVKLGCLPGGFVLFCATEAALPPSMVCSFEIIFK